MSQHTAEPVRTHAPDGGGTAAPYLDPYRRVVERSGACFESLLWRNREYQEVRFRTISEIVDLGGRVVADLGCGRADLLEWMREQGIAPARYIGVDALAPMVEFARARDMGRTDILLADFAVDELLPARLVAEYGVEVIVFSGSLNTHDQDQALDVLERAWGALERPNAAPGTDQIPPMSGSPALVFNFLSDRDGAGRRREEDEPGCPAHRFDLHEMTRWARERTRRMVLRQDYLEGHDATIGMFVEA